MAKNARYTGDGISRRRLGAGGWVQGTFFGDGGVPMRRRGTEIADISDKGGKPP